MNDEDASGDNAADALFTLYRAAYSENEQEHADGKDKQADDQKCHAVN